MWFQTWNETLPQFDVLGVYPLMTFFGIIFLFALMLYCYMKVRIFLVILVIYLFSLIIGFSALNESIIPFTPYLQLFFLVFQTIIFIIVALEVFRK